MKEKKTNEKEAATEIFNDYGAGYCTDPSGYPDTTGDRDDSGVIHEESVAQEFAELFRVQRVGGSLIFIGSNTTFEAAIPNGSTFQLRRTR